MITFRTLSGEVAQGIVWSPGPLPRSVWVLPRAGASASEAVVAKLPSPSYAKGSSYDVREMVEVSWRLREAVDAEKLWPSDRQAARNAPELPAKDWRELVADQLAPEG